MSKRTRWIVMISLAVAGLACIWFYVYINRTCRCFETDPDKWNQACADYAEVIAQKGNTRAMAALSLAYSNLNNRDRGFYWQSVLAELGSVDSIRRSAYLCRHHPSLTRSKVLQLIERHVKYSEQKAEFMEILDKYCPQTALIVD